MKRIPPRGKFWLTLIGAAIVVCIIWISVSPPGGQQTDNELKGPDAPPEPRASSLERLRSAWDSGAQADWPVAEVLAAMSNIAYQAAPDAKASYGQWGFNLIVPVIADPLAAFVVHEEDVTVIVFRGTAEAADWLVNLDAIPLNTPHGEMHRGFAEGYQTLKEQIVAALGQMQSKHLWVTGHSLGGALALVCAYDLIENQKMPLDGVMTFGQPMVAREGLPAYLDKLLLGRYAHVVNGADIVPRVPPGYAHCGSLVWFKDGVIRRSTPKRQMAKAAPGDASRSTDENPRPLTNVEFEQLKADLKKQKEARNISEPKLVQSSLPWIRDHSMIVYLDKVRSLIEGKLLRK